MNSDKLLHIVIGACSFFCSLTAQSYAIPRVWVSPSGSNVSGCGPAANPCRTFSYAMDVVDAKGEIDVRDPGEFGPFSVSKSVSVINRSGGTAAVNITSGSAIRLDLGGDGFAYIDGITLNGHKAATAAIWNDGNGSILVKNCSFLGVQYGFFNAGNHLNLSLLDNLFASNIYGVSTSNRNGSVALGEITRNSLINNRDGGVFFSSSGFSRMELKVSESIFVGGRFAILGDSFGETKLLIDKNTFAYSSSAGHVVSAKTGSSYGNNQFFRNNGPDLSISFSSASPK